MTSKPKYQFIFLIYLCLSVSSAYGQRTVLPIKNENFVIEIQGNKIVNKGKIDFPITKLFDVSEKGVIATVD
jgi:hypothetical protein